MSFIPIEVISEEHLDLNDRSMLLNYLEQDVYKKPYEYQWICTHTTTGNFTSAQYVLSSHESFLLIQENIYNKKQQLLVSSKHYIPIELFRIEVYEQNNAD